MTKTKEGGKFRTDLKDEISVAVGTSLLIKDLPPLAKKQDIIKMFCDFPLIDVMLIEANKVFRAYVKFYNQNDAETALNHTHTHRVLFKNVLVSTCSEEAYEKAKQEVEIIYLSQQ